MHILTLFPSLLTYGLIAPFLLRLSVGIFLVILAKRRYNKPYKWASVVYLVTGLFLIVGLYTQISALIGFFIMGFETLADRKVAPLSSDAVILHTICAVILISLIFTGPGFLAIDWPL